MKLIIFALSCLIFVGCKAPSYDVELFLSPKLKEEMRVYPSLEVDIVGVNENEGERFMNCAVDDYFEIGNALRAGTLHYTLYFSENDITPKCLSKENIVWEKFGAKEANHLYILVNLPVVNNNRGKKIVIPLERSWIFSGKKRYFEINQAGIIQLNEPPEYFLKK